MREDNLQAACFKWHWNTYPEQRYRLYHNFNNPPNSIKGAQLKAMGLIKGVADFTYLKSDGKILYMELKAEQGRQSKEQKRFEQVVTDLGHEYAIIRNFEEFQKKITENLLL